MKRINLILLIVLISIAAKAQVSLAPTAVYLDKNGLGTLYVTNNSETAQEITVNFQFGYSSQDENGVLIMVYNDSTNEKKHGLDNMIKAFPRTFTLPAGQQQIVRLQVRAPKELADGLYFTRLKVGSSGQVADVGTSSEATGISTRVNLRFEQVIVAFYKRGTPKINLNIDKVEASVDSDFVSIKIGYTNTGNAPFLGKVKMVLRDPSGKLVSESSQSQAMYFSGTRRVNFQLTEPVAAGSYELELKYETVRNDIAPEDLVQAPPYIFKTKLRLK